MILNSFSASTLYAARQLEFRAKLFGIPAGVTAGPGKLLMKLYNRDMMYLITEPRTTLNSSFHFLFHYPDITRIYPYITPHLIALGPLTVG